MVDYDVILKDGSHKKYRDEMCFSDWYPCAEEVKKWIVFVRKEYTGHRIQCESYHHEVLLSYEEISEYIGLLQKMGFKVSMREAHNWPGVWAFESAGNSIPATLILLNSIRDIYEDHRDEIIKIFLRYAKEESDLSLWNRFILAHYTNEKWMGHGHTFMASYDLHELLSDDQFQAILNSEEEISSLRGYFPLRKTNTFVRLFYEVSHDASLDIVLKTYQSLKKED